MLLTRHDSWYTNLYALEELVDLSEAVFDGLSDIKLGSKCLLMVRKALEERGVDLLVCLAHASETVDYAEES